METRITGGSPAARIWIDRQKEENGILFFDVNMLLEREESPEPFCVSFKTPDTDVYWAIVTCYTDSVVDCRELFPRHRAQCHKALVADPEGCGGKSVSGA